VQVARCRGDGGALGHAEERAKTGGELVRELVEGLVAFDAREERDGEHDETGDADAPAGEPAAAVEEPPVGDGHR
jgi:hypothetical protein